MLHSTNATNSANTTHHRSGTLTLVSGMEKVRSTSAAARGAAAATRAGARRCRGWLKPAASAARSALGVLVLGVLARKVRVAARGPLGRTAAVARAGTAVRRRAAVVAMAATRDLLRRRLGRLGRGGQLLGRFG